MAVEAQRPDIDVAELARTLDPTLGPATSAARRVGSQIALTSLTMVVIGALWELLSALDPYYWPEIILSRPSEIVPAFFQAISTGFVWENFWVTFQEALLGFVIGSSGAFVLGTLIALSANFRKATYPVVVLFQSTPRVALAPVFIAWFGFGISSKVGLAVTICFFPVLINTITGLTLVDENALLLMRSLKATRFQIFRRLRLPSATPTIFAGLKAAITFAVIGAIVGELVAANEGAGHLIETASFQFRMDDVFAYLLMLALFGLALFLLTGLVERKLIFWHTELDE